MGKKLVKDNNKKIKKKKCYECGFCIETFCILKMKVRKEENGKWRDKCRYFRDIMYKSDNTKVKKLNPDKLIQYHTFHKKRLYSSFGVIGLILSTIAIIISITGIFID